MIQSAKLKVIRMGPPPTKRHITLIENVQKLGLGICAKQWNLGYDERISSFDGCTLQTRLLEHKLCTMFKTVHNLISFPPILVPRHTSNLLLTQTPSYTPLFLALYTWNSLPSNVTSTPACTLAIAVVSIALEHKLHMGKKIQV